MDKLLLFASCAALATAAAPAPTSASPSLSCAILAKGRSIVVTGVSAGTGGTICADIAGRHDCQSARASNEGIAVRTVSSDLDGLVWFASNSPRVATTCSAIAASATDGFGALALSVLSMLGAFITGIVAVLLPNWLQIRRKSREAIVSWAGAYELQVRAFRSEPQVDLQPPPFPAVEPKEARKLAVVVEAIERILADSGYLPALDDSGRRALVDALLAETRAVRGR